MRIVVLSFDLPQHTAQTVTSAIEKVSPNEIILVHNGSSRKNVQRLKEKFPTIQHLVLEKNLHFSGGANRGLAYAFQQDEWVLFLTNDCLLKQMGSFPEQAGLYAPLIVRSKTGQVDSFGGYLEPQRFQLQHAKSSKEFFDSKIPYIPGTAFWMDRQSFFQLSGFDEDFQTYWEDVDLCLRAQQHKIPLRLNPDCHIEHGIGKTCQALPYYTTYLYQRNRRRMISRYSEHKIKAYFLWSKDNMRMLLFSLIRKDFPKLKLGLKAWID